MASKYCISCGREIDESSAFCPNCGANQNPQRSTNNPYQNYGSPNNKMTTTKILSFVALGLALVGVVFGGLFTEIAAVVISIIVLNSSESDKDSKLFARIALIISIILIVIMIAYLVLVGGFLFSQFHILDNLILNDL